jgi:cytochrome bd-type quinol oxidase subunit 2
MLAKKRGIKILIISFLTIFLVQVFFSFAQINKAFDVSDSSTSTYATFIKDSPNIKKRNINEIIYSSLNMFFSLLGVIFLILVIYGGAKWMTSRGNQEEIKKAKNILISSIIGLLIVLVAYALTWFIFNFFITTKLTIKK